MTNEQFKSIRKQRALSLKGMASLLCCNIRTVQRYEKGELSVPDWVVRILELSEGK
jgi:predicted transcriptional regulator